MAERLADTIINAADVVSLEGLPQGWKGTRRTLEAMADFVRRAPFDAGLRDFALYVVRDIPGHDFAAEIERLFYFVRNGITYRRDPVGLELVQDARRTLKRGAGDCDDKVVLLASLLACLGHRTRIIVISFGPPEFHHVALQVLHKGVWVDLDPTNEKAPPGWSVPAALKLAYAVN
jgi:transglutaminase-like putative cysteine protease